MMFGDKEIDIVLIEGGWEFLNTIKDDITDTDYMTRLACKAVREDSFTNITLLLHNTDCDRQKIAEYAAYYNRNTVVNEIIQLNSITNWNALLCGFAKNNNNDLINLAFKNGANDWNQVAIGAAKGNNLTLVKVALEKGATKYNKIGEAAAEYGKTLIIDFLVTNNYTSLGPIYDSFTNKDDVNFVACDAARHGLTRILNDLIMGLPDKDGNNICADDWIRIAEAAAEGGYNDIVYRLIDTEIDYKGDQIGGVHDWNRLAKSAAMGQNITLLKDMVKRGANDFYDITTTCAAFHDNVDIINYLVEVSDIDINSVALSAMLKGNTNIVRRAIELGADNFDDIASVAGSHDEIVEEMVRLGANKAIIKKLKDHKDRLKRLELNKKKQTALRLTNFPDSDPYLLW